MVGAPTWTLAVAASFSLTELEAADPGAKSLTAAPITAVHVGSLRVGRRSKSEGPQRNAAQGCVCAVCMRCAMRRTYMEDYVALGLSESSNNKQSGLVDD